MGTLRKYGEFPAFFVPDEGEVVLAARSVGGPYLRAAVTSVRRASRERVRIDFRYLEASPVSATGKGCEVQEKGHVYIHVSDRVPRIRRIPGQQRLSDAA